MKNCQILFEKIFLPFTSHTYNLSMACFLGMTYMSLNYIVPNGNISQKISKLFEKYCNFIIIIHYTVKPEPRFLLD